MDSKKDLMELPEKIRAKEISLLNKSAEFNELEFVMARYRNNELLKIADMKENGKTIFSNELKREAEVERILKLDEQYRTYQLDMRKMDKEIKEARIELDFLKRTFRAMEAIIRGEDDE